MINCCLMNSLHLKSIQNKIVDAIGADGMEFLLHTKNYFTATLLLKGIYHSHIYISAYAGRLLYIGHIYFFSLYIYRTDRIKL